MRGRLAEGTFKSDIVDKFRQKFLKEEYRSGNTPAGFSRLLWCNFKEQCKIYKTELLFQLQLGIEAVYFYDERTDELFCTTFEKVSAFINSFEPWDEVDAEIFDDSMEWVIAVTHEDVSLVFGVDVGIEEYDYERDMAQGE
ncbi:MAG: hypothetical protein LBV33_09120 [Lachnospiraceae bacterium]|jgi:hypothetical protein|nr:hypothetical protein [Lachnospiraceae bacterium]